MLSPDMLDEQDEPGGDLTIYITNEGDVSVKLNKYDMVLFFSPDQALEVAKGLARASCVAAALRGINHEGKLN